MKRDIVDIALEIGIWLSYIFVALFFSSLFFGIYFNAPLPF